MSAAAGDMNTASEWLCELIAWMTFDAPSAQLHVTGTSERSFDQRA